MTVILLARFGLTKDPNPNPIGFGILAFLTLWPSVIMMIVGVTTSCPAQIEIRVFMVCE